MKNDKTIFDKSLEGSGSFSCEQELNIGNYLNKTIPEEYIRRGNIGLPEISEREVVKHYTHLSERTFSVDSNFYPLGSCTMKYNPRINEDLSSLKGFTMLHPLQESVDCQGTLELLYEFERKLSFICGMDSFTLQPAAGANGELTALLVARKYFSSRKENRKKVVVPDSSHGTNPASATIAGFELVTIPSKDGEVDMEALKKECDGNLAVFMLTNPNTLGIFERNVVEICKVVHACGGLTYMDGANMNALLGVAKPGDMGFDMMHVNLHKTFSAPHGGGGPGSGPVGVKKHLVEFLPVPFIVEEDNYYSLSFERNNSIGCVKTFWGNFQVILKAAIYVDSIGMNGLQETSKGAIISANYLKKKLSRDFNIPVNRPCMHEFVMTPDENKSPAKTLDIAKRLLDYGVHAPTIYFPLIVKEAIMIEPTETENIQVLDEFVEVMFEIAKEARENPQILHDAPLNTFRRRLDEVKAARNPVLKWAKKD